MPISKKPGPVSEFLGTPDGRSFVFVSRLSSSPVRSEYGLPLFHVTPVLALMFQGSLRLNDELNRRRAPKRPHSEARS